MATAAQFARWALAFEGAAAGSHMAHPDFRVDGRIFATLQPDRRRGMVRLSPAQQRRWLTELGDAAAPASGAWGRAGCTLVVLADLDATTAKELLLEAWQTAKAARPAKKRQPRTP